MGALPACTYIHNVSTAHGVLEGGSPDAGLADGDEAPYGCWEKNLGPL